MSRARSPKVWSENSRGCKIPRHLLEILSGGFVSKRSTGESRELSTGGGVGWGNSCSRKMGLGIGDRAGHCVPSEAPAVGYIRDCAWALCPAQCCRRLWASLTQISSLLSSLMVQAQSMAVSLMGLSPLSRGRGAPQISGH